MIEVIAPEFIHGEITRVVQVKSKHKIMDHKNRMFDPKYASVTWKRDNIGDKWYVIGWEIYSDKGSVRGKNQNAPDYAEAIFKATKPRINF